MQIFRWRDVLSLKAYAVPSITASTYFASFHSTPYSCEKWKNKWNSAIRGGQLPSKSYAKYVMRQKRADAKKALKDLLYRSGSSKFSFENQETWKFGDRNFYGDQNYDSESCCNKRQAKSHQQPGKSKKKVKHATPGPLETGRGPSVSIQPLALNGGNIQIGQSQTVELGNGKSASDAESDDDCNYSCYVGSQSERNVLGLPLTVTEAQPRLPNVSTNSSNFSEHSTSGFEWREHSNWTKSNSRTRKWKSASDAESDDDCNYSCYVGSQSERNVLGLPLTGPLKLEDVKNAFRLSALKWHPDKHQGPSQAVAEEKFKMCLDAYKSLCSVLSPA